MTKTRAQWRDSWLSHDVINFTGGQLKIDTQSLEGNNFSLYVLTFCLAASMCNFVRFVHFSTVKSSIHFGLTPAQIYCKMP